MMQQARDQFLNSFMLTRKGTLVQKYKINVVADDPGTSSSKDEEGKQASDGSAQPSDKGATDGSPANQGDNSQRVHRVQGDGSQGVQGGGVNQDGNAAQLQFNNFQDQGMIAPIKEKFSSEDFESLSHLTQKVFRQQIQAAIEGGKIKFDDSKRPMKVDGNPFPVNMVHSAGRIADVGHARGFQNEKRRVQRLRSRERFQEVEQEINHRLKKTKPKQDRRLKNQVPVADEATADEAKRLAKGKSVVTASVNMVFTLPAEFGIKQADIDEVEEELAKLILSPEQAVFEKSEGTKNQHLKPLYINDYVNGKPISKMMVDGGATNPEEPTKEDDENEHKNAQAANAILSALSGSEFNRVNAVIWDTLRNLHEGMVSVRESKVEILKGQFERFVMLDGESPRDMYDRLSKIVNEIKGLGSKDMTDEVVVKKMVRAITPRNSTLVTIIRERPDYKTLTPHDLLGRILAHDMLEQESKEVIQYINQTSTTSIKKEDLALKAKEEEEESHKSKSKAKIDDEEMALKGSSASS
ncbi:intracellular protein transport protein USO1-like [Oryza sativa Japonica Group]|uniref:intracellular protein transport protein USO1-like n=1 Tax=Oryza sativa subsp. japonica TaxID=39947 RepID=UPI00339D1A89